MDLERTTTHPKIQTASVQPSKQTELHLVSVIWLLPTVAFLTLITCSLIATSQSAMILLSCPTGLQTSEGLEREREINQSRARDLDQERFEREREIQERERETQEIFKRDLREIWERFERDSRERERAELLAPSNTQNAHNRALAQALSHTNPFSSFAHNPGAT